MTSTFYCHFLKIVVTSLEVFLKRYRRKVCKRFAVLLQFPQGPWTMVWWI